MKNIFVLAMICCLVYGAFILNGCTPAIDPNLVPFAEDLGVEKNEDAEALAAGRKFYVLKCAGCHNHIYPSEYTPAQWKMTLRDHVGRVHLTKAEYELLKNIFCGPAR